MKFFIFIAVALLIFPLATAFNCNDLNGGDRDICNSIKQNPDLTSEEKDLLISDIFNVNKTTPNHDFVYMWNTNLNIKNSPDNKYYNRGVINKAWLKIITIMPSILEDNVLYVSQNGKIQTEYNYQYSLPSSRYRKDCKTRYYLESNTATLTIYLNGKNIGNSKLTNFNLNQENANFIAVLDIRVRYRIKHYRDYGDGCEYYDSDYVTDTITITDNFNAKLYSKTPKSSFKINNKYNGITEGSLQVNDSTSFELSFEDSLFKKTDYIYSFDYKLPYYAITLKAEKIENTEIKNLRINKIEKGFEFFVVNIENCKINLFTHFGKFTQNCDLSFNNINLKIKTDKLNYNENDSIKVEIFPKDILVELNYANQTIKAKNNAEFISALNYNKITAKYESFETIRIINVTSSQNKKLAIDLSSLGLFGYIIYSFLKKYSFNLI